MSAQRKRWTKLLSVVALSATLGTVAVLHAAKGGKKPPTPPPPNISYTITFLGTLGGPYSEPVAMNELGDVLGRSRADDGTLNDWTFVYFNDTDTMVDLRALLSQDDLDTWRWDLFYPNGINSMRQISGQALKHNESGVLRSYAVRITLPQVEGEPALVETIPSPAPEIKSAAVGINEFGDVTGSYHLPGDIHRAFVYSDDLGSLDLGDLAGGATSGVAINNHGEVTGWSENANGDWRAFLFVPGSGMEDLGVIRDAGGTYSNNSVGVDLNDSTNVVGWSVAGKRRGTPVVHAFGESGSGMLDLSVLDGDARSEATSINASGEIVGSSESADRTRLRGFLYTDEYGLLELNSLIDNLPANTGRMWGVRNNDAGEICGALRLADGTYEAFLLTPNP